MNNYSGAQGLGNMRFNTSTQSVEVWDGSMWKPMEMSTVNVSLTPDAVDAISWVNRKRHEEMKIKELAEKHPAVADQLAAVHEAEEKLRMITLLVTV
jgi:uncharacterized heparinase superfamily protein